LGEIIKIDLNGFHLRIIDNIIKPSIIPFDEDAHTYIASLLLNKNTSNITPEEREEVKQINFTLLYSPNINTQYIKATPFFDKINTIKQNINEFKTIYNRQLDEKY